MLGGVAASSVLMDRMSVLFQALRPESGLGAPFTSHERGHTNDATGLA